VVDRADLLSSVGLSISVAAVLAFVAHRLKQPLLLAYLLAAVAAEIRAAGDGLAQEAAKGKEMKRLTPVETEAAADVAMLVASAAVIA
jgi:hypothetical protein